EAAASEALRSEQGYNLDYRIVLEDGTVRHVHEQAEVALQDHGRRSMVGTIQDISERKQAEERIRFLADYDTLTHLPNRRLFSERLSLVLTSARLEERLVAVLCLDLDHFKR